MLNNSHFVCENVNGFPRVYVIPFLAILKDKKKTYSVEMAMWDFIVEESHLWYLFDELAKISTPKKLSLLS